MCAVSMLLASMLRPLGSPFLFFLSSSDGQPWGRVLEAEEQGQSSSPGKTSAHVMSGRPSVVTTLRSQETLAKVELTTKHSGSNL